MTSPLCSVNYVDAHLSGLGIHVPQHHIMLANFLPIQSIRNITQSEQVSYQNDDISD